MSRRSQSSFHRKRTRTRTRFRDRSSRASSVRLLRGTHPGSCSCDHHRWICRRPLQPRIRFHCSGRNCSQKPGHCYAGNPHQQPERQRLLGIHVACFWSIEHLLILPARGPVSSNKFNQMRAKYLEIGSRRGTPCKPLNRHHLELQRPRCTIIYSCLRLTT